MIASLMSFQGGLSDTITYPFFRLGMIWSIHSTWCARRVQAERDQAKKDFFITNSIFSVCRQQVQQHIPRAYRSLYDFNSLPK